MVRVSESHVDRDDVVRREYAAIDETADQIVTDPSLAESFCQQVNAQLAAELQFDIAELNARLLNLRRRGEENGGLVRKQRRFRGRNCKPR